MFFVLLSSFTTLVLLLRSSRVVVASTMDEEQKAREFPKSTVDSMWTPTHDVFRNDTFRVNCSQPICTGSMAPIYCHGPVVWASWYFGLSGVCPGPKLRRMPSEVLNNFNKLYNAMGEIRRTDYVRFCQENFDNKPYLEKAELADWTPEPDIIHDLSDASMKRFAQRLHELWRDLARKFADDVQRNPDMYPVLPVPNVFIVPSSVQQVYYLWDTLWIIRGLLISGLFDTARGILENFVHVRKTRSYLPNNGYIWSLSGLCWGSRRSQPPLFAHMIFVYFEATGDREFLMRMLPEVEQETNWLQTYRSIQVPSPRNNLTLLTVYLYRTQINCPRAEAFLEDYYLAMQSGRDPEFFWSSTHSAIESGSDFSTRWYTMAEQSDGDEDLTYTRKGIKTGLIVPVCLNVMIARNFQILAQLYGAKLANNEKAMYYQGLANSLIQAIDELLLDRSDPMGVWYDWDLEMRVLRKKFYPSTILPLFLLNEASDTNKKMRDCSAAVRHLHNSGVLSFKGGIPSSAERRAFDLWDFPNAWPPHQEWITGCLLRCNELPEAFLIAKQVADRFLHTAYKGLFYPRPGMPAQMWEKYDVRFDDGRSRLGDRAAQGQLAGFGWSNGLALIYMKIFYTNNTSVATLTDDATTNVTALQEFFMFDTPERVRRPDETALPATKKKSENEEASVALSTSFISALESGAGDATASAAAEPAASAESSSFSSSSSSSSLVFVRDNGNNNNNTSSSAPSPSPSTAFVAAKSNGIFSADTNPKPPSSSAPPLRHVITKRAQHSPTLENDNVFAASN